MDGFIMAAQLIVALSILVTVHEWGHFIAARAFGIRVEKFYLFFDAWGVKLFSVKKGDTEYGIGWLPLGGYVKISGMIDESLDTEQLKQAPQPWEFRSKPAWQRLIVMIGGVVMNVVLGVIIFAMMTFVNGEKQTKIESVSNGVVASELAQSAGFKTGDKLLAVNGKPILHFEDALNPEYIFEKGTVYTVERNGTRMDVKLPDDFLSKLTTETKSDFLLPRQHFYIAEVIAGSPSSQAGLKANDVIIAVDSQPITYFDEFQYLLSLKKDRRTTFTVKRGAETLHLTVNVDSNGKLGFKSGTNDFTYDVVKYSFLASIPRGISKAMDIISLQLTNWKHIFTGDISFSKSVSGPIGIATVFGPKWDWNNFWVLTGLISLGLAFMNILPIPALDGGHVILLSVEAITRKRLSDKAMERTQMVGMVILLALMAFVIVNDIIKVAMR